MHPPAPRLEKAKCDARGQKGITYFVDGSGGELRKGDLARSAMTAAGYDQDCVFTLVEIVKSVFHFQAVTRTGVVVDSGTIQRQ